VFKGDGDFPANRSELYKQGLDVLLKKWDSKRCIERDQVYKNSSVQRKQDLLSHIALTTFEQKKYLFKQGMVERYIADFMRTELQELELDSEAVLKSIEAQHGLLVEQADRIYSFSHLTFHEYFTARWFVERADVGWQDLVNHVTEKHWREVFLIAVEIVNNPEQLLLLMKQKIDKLIADIDTIQEFLKWVHEEALRIQDSVKKFSYKPAAIRAFNLARALELEIPPEYLKNTLLPPVNFEPSPGPYGLLPNLCQFALSYNLSDALDLARISTFNLERGYWLARILDPDLAYHLHQLLQQLEVPNWDEYEESVEDWWSANGQFWTEKLRTVIVEYRNFGHNWQFSNEHQELLKQYYDGNQLLVDCLNSDCYVSREIEETLLLPMAEIEKRHR
jgi:predicted NACHT family NTPase